MPDLTSAGPFGPARQIETVPVEVVADMYRAKCAFDTRPHFGTITALKRFECVTTGYRYWRPKEAAGDESFYRGLSAAWPDYYRDWRWEYGPVLSMLKPTDCILEIGSGRGFFLKHTEGLVKSAVGLDLNQDAIEHKVTRNDILASTVEDFSASHRDTFDAVCSFQVLEHMTSPETFFQAAIACLKPGGSLFFSTPNALNAAFANREDAFDLPPHHMGQFSPAVYRRLAKLYGLRIRRVMQESRFVERGSSITSSIKRLLNVAHRAIRGPGPTVLAVLRKP